MVVTASFRFTIRMEVIVSLSTMTSTSMDSLPSTSCVVQMPGMYCEAVCVMSGSGFGVSSLSLSGRNIITRRTTKRIPRTAKIPV